jgi:hypothetical protein
MYCVLCVCVCEWARESLCVHARFLQNEPATDRPTRGRVHVMRATLYGRSLELLGPRRLNQQLLPLTCR